MLAISAIMMPAQTNSLNQLPKELYSHGTAVMTTLQPVGGAIGVAIFVGILNVRQNALLERVADPSSLTAMNDAFVGGMKLVYLVLFALALISFVMSLFMYRAVPAAANESAAKQEQTQ